MVTPPGEQHGLGGGLRSLTALSSLVLGWVTADGQTMPVYNQPPRSAQPGHPSTGRQ